MTDKDRREITRMRREARYQVIMAVLRSFLRKKVISMREYRIAEEMMMEK